MLGNSCKADRVEICLEPPGVSENKMLGAVGTASSSMMNYCTFETVTVKYSTFETVSVSQCPLNKLHFM